ncbi:unnamed protein product [Rhizopus microsporus]
MVAGTERGPVEAAIGDFASDKATKRKLYHDKLKSVLASKCHLNALIEKLNFLSAGQSIHSTLHSSIAPDNNNNNYGSY